MSPGDDDGSVSFSERNRRVAARLTEWVAQSGARTDHITITFDALERRVVLSGRVSSQSEREIVVLVVGNSRGVAQVDDQLVVDDGDPISTFYTVVAGDTLAKIARAQLGDPMKYHAIFDANRPML
ncbi:MAG: BON domain-containing protein, partial [Myxococcota bacterium]